MVVENTITDFPFIPANVPEVKVPWTTVPAAALVVLNEIVDDVPLFQLTVALPVDEPFPQLRLPAPDALTLPLVIPATPLQLENVPENV